MIERADVATLAKRHAFFGFVGLSLFIVLGLALEAMHAFKTPLYLDVGNESRRLMWRLAHAHGALLSLVNIAYGLVAARFDAAASQLTSRLMLLSLVTVPFGFFAGGITVHGGDPGVAVAFVPMGALALLIGTARAAAALRR